MDNAERWYCNIDRVEMVEAEIPMKYLGLTERVRGLRCPKCGTSYLTEETAEQVSAGETQLEAK